MVQVVKWQIPLSDFLRRYLSTVEDSVDVVVTFAFDPICEGTIVLLASQCHGDQGVLVIAENVGIVGNSANITFIIKNSGKFVFLHILVSLFVNGRPKVVGDLVHQVLDVRLAFEVIGIVHRNEARFDIIKFTFIFLLERFTIVIKYTEASMNTACFFDEMGYQRLCDPLVEDVTKKFVHHEPSGGNDEAVNRGFTDSIGLDENNFHGLLILFLTVRRFLNFGEASTRFLLGSWSETYGEFVVVRCDVVGIVVLRVSHGVMNSERTEIEVLLRMLVLLETSFL